MTERTQIHLLSDVLVAVASLNLNSQVTTDRNGKSGSRNSVTEISILKTVVTLFYVKPVDDIDSALTEVEENFPPPRYSFKLPSSGL